MKTFKRTVSIFLAALMLLGSVSVFATLDDGFKRTLTSQVRFYREDNNGDWVETTKVAKGEHIEARIILQSDFIVGAHQLYYLYNKDVLSVDETRQTSSLLISYDAEELGGDIYWKDSDIGTEIDNLISKGYLDASVRDDFGFIKIVATEGKTHIFDGIEELYSVYFVVNDDVDSNAVASMFIPTETKMVTSATDPNFIDLPTYGAKCMVEEELGKDMGVVDGYLPYRWDNDFEVYNLPSTNITTVGAAQGDDAATIEANTNITYNVDKTTTSSYVTIGPDVDVTFTVEGDDNFNEIKAIPFGSPIAGNEPAYTAPFGYDFAGWPKNASDATVDDNGNAQATEIVNGQTVTGTISPKTITATFYTPAGLSNDGAIDLSEVDPDEASGIDTVRWQKASGTAAVRRRPESVEFTFGETALVQPYAWQYQDLDSDNFYFRGWAATGNPEEIYDGETTFFTPTGSMTVYGVYDEDALKSTIDTTTIPESAYVDDGEGNLTLYLLPVFAPIPTENYTVTWDAKDLEVNTITIAPQEVVANTVIAAADVPAVAEENGYDFVWYSDDTYETKAVWPFTVTSDTTFYGRYEAQKFTVTYKYVDDKGATIREDTVVNDVAYGTAVEVPAAPAVENYTINTAPENFTMPAAAVEKTYVYDRNEFTLTYKYMAGETEIKAAETSQVKHGDDVVVPDAPSITGYTLAENGKPENTVMPTSDLTLTYLYTANKNTVTYNYVDGDGNAIKDADGNDIAPTVVNDVVFGTEVEVPAAPEYTGYTIATSPANFTMPDEAVSKNYVYTLNSHTLKFIVDGEEKSSESKDWNSAIAAPTVDIPEGMEFKGWFSDADCSVEATVPAKMPDNDLTFYGKIEPIKYKLTVNYVDADGNAIADPAVFEGDNAIAFGTALADTVEIKTIAHYDYDADATNIPATMPAAEATVNVVYNIHTNAITYYATEDASGEPLETVADIPYGGEIEIPADEPEKEGYTFAGWKYSYTEDGNAVTFNSTDDDFDTKTMPDAAVTATPIFEVNEYGIVYKYIDANGAEQVAEDLGKIAFGEDVEVTSEEPEKEGYHLNADTPWKDEDGKTPEDYGTMPAKDLVFWAQFDPNNYTYKFVTNVDGYTIDDITAAYDADITAPTVAADANPGYRFAGWYEEATLETAYTIPAKMPALGADGASKTLYAKWSEADTEFTINVYTMDAEGNYGEPVVKAGSGTTGEELTRDELLTQAGVTAAEGFEINTATTLDTFTVPATAGVYNIYIDRVKATYTINLDGGELTGTYSPSGEYYYGAAITAPQDEPTKANYNFKGWDTEFPATMPANDVTVTAQWKHYTAVTFIENEGTVETVVNVEEGEDYTREYQGEVDPGYEFAGWSTDPDANPDDVSKTITAGTEDSITYHPIFRALEYTVTYKLAAGGDTSAKWADGSIADVVVTLKTGDSVPAAPEATRTGYHYTSMIGEDEEGTQYAEVPTTMPAHNLVFEIQWEPNEHSIIYKYIDENGDEQVVEDMGLVAFGDDVEVTADEPTLTGYTLDADTPWKDEDGKAPEDYDGMPDKDLVFWAQFNVNSYAFRAFYVDEDSNEIAFVDELLEYNAPIDKANLAAPDRSADGYEFKGWSPALDEIPDNMPAQSVTVEALYELVKITVTYKYVDENNEEIDTATVINDVEYGTEITPPEHTIDGYEIVETPAAFTAGADDITKTYKYKAAEYTVTYKYIDINGQPVLDGSFNAVADTTAQVKYKAEVDLTPADFAGYMILETRTAPALVEGKMPAEDVTVTFVYVINEYTITFVTGDGATQIPEATYAFGADVTAPADPEKEGNDFQGWYEDAEFTTAATIPAKMPAEDLTFYAKFGTNTITLSFVDEDGTPLRDDVSGEYDTAIPAIADPEKEGYTFAGWDPALPEKFPADDTTYTATWDINQHNVTYVSDGNPVSDAQVDFGGDVAATVPTTDPEKVGYIFTGWKDADGNAPDYYATMPAKDLVFEAQWYSRNVVVDYIVDGVSVFLQSVPYAQGSVTVKVLDDVQTWHYNAEDGTEYAPGSTYTFTEDDVDGVKFYGTYEETGTVEITFDADGGKFADDETSKVVSADIGTVPAAPADPTREGYDFVGWTPEIGVAYADTTYKAVWEAKDITVTYKDEDGNTIESFDQTYGEPLEVPADPEKEGYTFKEWKYTNADTGEEIEAPETVPAFPINAEAVYDVNTYKVTYDVNGGTAVDPAEVELDFGAQLPTAPETSREGYEFTGWVCTNDETGDEIAVPATMPAYDITLTAQWEVKQYTIKLYYNDENGREIIINEITQDYDTDVATQPDPTREGYSFDGWAEQIPAKMPAEDKAIEALWTALKFNFTVDLDGGEFPAGTTDPSGEYDYNSDVPALTDPEQEGHEFTGWIYTNAETGEEISAPAKMPAYDVKATATWDTERYTITLFYVDENNDEVIIDTITQEFDTAIATPADPTREGYTFAGWAEQIPAKMPAENKRIEALWNVNSYNFTVNLDGGELADGATDPSGEVAYGADVPAVPEVKKTGYSLDATQPWIYTNAETGDEISAPAKMPANDVEAKANWVINEWTVTYNPGNGDPAEEIDVTYGEPIDTPNDPEKEGFTLDATQPRIYTDPDGNEYTGDTMPDYPLTAEANWVRNQYKITYDVNGGDAIDPDFVSVDFEAAIPDEPAVTREGYSLDATQPWIYTKASDGSDFAGDTMPAYDLTAKANWVVNKYTLTVDLAGGSFAAGAADPSGEYEFGAAVTIPDAEKVGNTFAGWKYTDTDTGAEISFDGTMPARNVTATAQYGTVSYTITFESNGGSAVEAITANYDADITAPADPTKAGFTFAGWYEDNDTFAVPYTVPAKMPARNITVYAKWTAIVKLVAKEGTDTMVERDGIVETYATVSENPNGVTEIKAVDRDTYTYTAADYEAYFISGLKTGIAVADFGNYVEVTGGGHFTIDPATVAANGKVGTGTKVNVYADDAETELVETFYIVIYGDVDGNGRITNADTVAVNSELSDGRVWSDPAGAYSKCRVKAADLNQDSHVTNADYIALAEYMNKAVKIDQITGKTVTA